MKRFFLKQLAVVLTFAMLIPIMGFSEGDINDVPEDEALEGSYIDADQQDADEYIVAIQEEQIPAELDDMDLPSEDEPDVDDTIVYVTPQGEEEDEENIFDSYAVPEDPKADSDATSDEQDTDAGNATNKQDITSDEVPEEAASSEGNTDAMIVSSMDNDTNVTPENEDETESNGQSSSEPESEVGSETDMKKDGEVGPAVGNPSDAEYDNEDSTNEQKEKESDVERDSIGDEAAPDRNTDLSDQSLFEAQSIDELNLPILEESSLNTADLAVNTSQYPLLLEALVTISEKDFLNAAYASEGGSWTNGYCLAWVKCFWESLGGPSSTDCCARHYFQSRIVSTSKDNIPIGADIFLYDNRNSPTICGTCGGRCGHIGVYVGEGKFISTLTSNGSTFIRNRSISDWESWGYGFAGWGWHDGVRVSNTGSSTNGSTSTTSINKTYRIKSTTTLGLNIRPSATTASSSLGLLYPGVTINCTKRTNYQSDGYYWLYGTTSTGITGWICENMGWIEEVQNTPASSITSTTSNSTTSTTTTSTTTTSTSPTTKTTPTRTVTKSAKYKAKVGLLCQLLFKNGETAKSFKSSNTKVLTVSSTGLVTIKAVGKAKITIKTNKRKYTLTIKTYDPTIPTKLSLSVPKTTIKIGGSITLTPVIPSGTNTTYTWQTSNKRVATVTNGTVTFKKKGRVTITCIANRGKKKAKVTFKSKQ